MRFDQKINDDDEHKSFGNNNDQNHPPPTPTLTPFHIRYTYINLLVEFSYG